MDAPSFLQDMTEQQSPRALYYIEAIPYKTAMEIVVKQHYLHRKGPCSFAFGLFCNQSNRILGVVTYGTPSSAPLRRGICGEDESNNVIELTRLWIEDGTPKNTESYLIANTIKKINKQIVVSYADTAQNHIGVVYQAANWLYTGLSAKRTNWTVDGMDKHCQTIADKYDAVEIRNKYGDKFTLTPRSRKHRYVYLNCKGKRKKQLMQKLKYQVQPYPKHKHP